MLNLGREQPSNAANIRTELLKECLTVLDDIKQLDSGMMPCGTGVWGYSVLKTFKVWTGVDDKKQWEVSCGKHYERLRILGCLLSSASFRFVFSYH